MSEPTMRQFEQEFARLYGDSAYADAYELATREMGRFPAWAQNVPAAWSTGDRFSYFMEYEAASLEDTNFV